VDEFNKTGVIEPYFWFTLNNQRELFYNKSKTINMGNSFLEAQKGLYIMYSSANDL